MGLFIFGAGFAIGAMVVSLLFVIVKLCNKYDERVQGVIDCCDLMDGEAETEDLILFDPCASAGSLNFNYEGLKKSLEAEQLSALDVQSLRLKVSELQEYKDNAEEEKRKQAEEQKRIEKEAKLKSIQEEIDAICKVGDYVYYLDEKMYVEGVVCDEPATIKLEQALHPFDRVHCFADDWCKIKPFKQTVGVNARESVNVSKEIEAEIAKIEQRELARSSSTAKPAPVKLDNLFTVDGQEGEWKCHIANSTRVCGAGVSPVNTGKDIAIGSDHFEKVKPV